MKKENMKVAIGMLCTFAVVISVLIGAGVFRPTSGEIRLHLTTDDVRVFWETVKRPSIMNYKAQDGYAKSAASKMMYAYIAEEDIFSKQDVIFKGTVLECRSLDMQFNGEDVPVYMGSGNDGSLVKFRVEYVYQGGLRKWETVTVYVGPYCGVAKYLEKGKTGIFTVSMFDENDHIAENGAKLMLLDIADGGLVETGCFYEHEGHLQMSHDWQYVYGRFDGQVSELRDVEDYLAERFEKE